ncbi:DUF1957 domain-containing protein [Treponema sp.]
MSKHSVLLVLHAHLPFVRHPEHQRFLEERWLFEAISETYIPLLQMFERLEADKIPFRLAISFSSPLCQMLHDDLLRNRYIAHLDKLIEFGSKEVERSESDTALHQLARYYYDKAIEDRVLFTERYEKDILKAFDYYHKKGRLELLTGAATHAFLPFLASHPEALQAQIEVAQTLHRTIFGRNPQGFWLPDLGWFPGIDEYLRSYNYSYTIVDTHAVLFGEPCPSRGTFAPMRTAQGLTIFSRDLASTREVWDKDTGYPANPVYRDFYRDAGYDLPAELVQEFLEYNGARTQTGFKYYAVGKCGLEKKLYNSQEAGSQVKKDAQSFLDSRLQRGRKASNIDKTDTSAVCAYDADLFGHWWFEGVQFLEELFRLGSANTFQELSFTTPSDELSRKAPSELDLICPEFSSWGQNGFAETWLDASNDWTYRHILRSIDRMIELAERFPDEVGLKERALNQAAREILLSQSSDWASLMHGQSSSDYGRSRVEDCIRNFTHIYDSLGGNYISTEWLTALEKRHNIFPQINYRIYRKKQ